MLNIILKLFKNEFYCRIISLFENSLGTKCENWIVDLIVVMELYRHKHFYRLLNFIIDFNNAIISTENNIQSRLKYKMHIEFKRKCLFS